MVDSIYKRLWETTVFLQQVKIGCFKNKTDLPAVTVLYRFSGRFNVISASYRLFVPLDNCNDCNQKTAMT